jgi:hypothetical protein
MKSTTKTMKYLKKIAIKLLMGPTIRNQHLNKTQK